MDAYTNELRQTATQLLTGLLANPHIYLNRSDEGSQGQLEQELMIVAVEMAVSLLETVNQRSQSLNDYIDK
jgi:hypothetical protein